MVHFLVVCDSSWPSATTEWSEHVHQDHLRPLRRSSHTYKWALRTTSFVQGCHGLRLQNNFWRVVCLNTTWHWGSIKGNFEPDPPWLWRLLRAVYGCAGSQFVGPPDGSGCLASRPFLCIWWQSWIFSCLWPACWVRKPKTGRMRLSQLRLCFGRTALGTSEMTSPRYVWVSNCIVVLPTAAAVIF